MSKHELHDSYPSVVNLHNPDQLKIFCDEFPELSTCDWAIEEKFHGFNFQVTYLPESVLGYEPDYAGSREIQITRGMKFYGAWSTIDDEKLYFQKVRDYSRQKGIRLTMYMEIYGGKISQGIDYNFEQGKRRLRFIGTKINDSLLPPKDFYDLMYEIGIPIGLYSFPMAIVTGVEAILAYNPVFRSIDAISGDYSKTPEFDRTFAEGFVAKPFHKHYINKGEKNILIKIKNPVFEEFKKTRVRTPRIIAPEINELRDSFKEFLNMNRIQSAFSKIGPITSKEQIMTYLKFIMNDAKEDFEEQYDAEYLKEFSAEDMKSIYNVGNFLSKQLINIIDSNVDRCAECRHKRMAHKED